MRTIDLWEGKWRLKTMNVLFPPRIVQNLLTLPEPENLPEKPRSVYLHGDTESGKTIYACQLLLHFAKLNYLHPTDDLYRSCFMPETQLFQEVKKTYDKKSEKTESEILAYYQKQDILVIDDLGRNRVTPWFHEILYIIINYRYEYLLPTIITSNYDLPRLSEMLEDDRIPSRIVRMGDVIEKIPWNGKQ